METIFIQSPSTYRIHAIGDENLQFERGNFADKSNFFTSFRPSSQQ